MNQKKKWKFNFEYFLVGVPFYITGVFFFRMVYLISVDDAWLSAIQACAMWSYPKEICVSVVAGMAMLCFYTVIIWAISLTIWFFWRKFHKK